MKKHSKWLLYFLVGGLLLSGCSKKADSSTSQTQADSKTESASSEETKELQPNLPDVKYDGYEFKILMKGADYVEWASQDIDATEITGEVINDAVYSRNAYVEEKYDVTITGIEGKGNMAQTAKKSILAEDNSFDVLNANMYDTSALATSGALADLHTIPNLDLSQPWWDQRANADLSINHKLYFTVGDLLIMPNDATWLVIFNKTLIKEHNLESPYDLVRNNQWTFDKMVSMTKGVSRDLNGDGAMDENDMFGHISQYENASGFLLGFGEKVVSKDKDDLPFFSINNDRAVGSMGKVFDFLLDPSVSINFQDLTQYPRPFEITQKIFEENRGLFKTTAIQLVIRMRNMNTDFGIVPMPKLDAQQSTYYNFVHPTTSCISVPVSNRELERTGVILEALAAKSRYTVRNAYYDISLNGKFLRDEESSEMLDIILDTRMYDVSQIYDWGGMGGIFQGMMAQKTKDFSSLYAKKEKAAIQAMAKTVDAYLSVSGE